jgi:hypothetical protein
MLHRQHRTQISSVEELISSLEPVEPDELNSDIRANVRAELKRIKRNVSLILDFTSSSRSSESGTAVELERAIADVRRQCLVINSTVSEILILQALRADKWIEYNSRVRDQYAAMAEAVRNWCAIVAPLQLKPLADAL